MVFEFDVCSLVPNQDGSVDEGRSSRRLNRAILRADRRIQELRDIGMNLRAEQFTEDWISYEPRRHPKLAWLLTRHGVTRRWRDEEGGKTKSKLFGFEVGDRPTDVDFTDALRLCFCTAAAYDSKGS